MSDNLVLLILVGIFGILPIIYSLIFFLVSLRQLGEIQEEVRKLVLVVYQASEIHEEISERLEEIEKEVIDIKRLDSNLDFVKIQAVRMVDLFTILNRNIVEQIDNDRR